MRKRTLGRTGIQVGELGMGCEGFVDKSPEQIRELVDSMASAGVTCIDLYTPNPAVRDGLGLALAGRRDSFVLQAHLCTIWRDGQYKRTRNLAEVKEGFAEQLRLLGTDYLDIGMIHYADAMSDWEAVVKNGILDYARELKAQGAIRSIGLSSHNPEVALAAVETGEIDVLMFSVNP